MSATRPVSSVLVLVRRIEGCLGLLQQYGGAVEAGLAGDAVLLRRLQQRAATADRRPEAGSELCPGERVDPLPPDVTRRHRL
jgi:hypothetical protein